MQRQMISEDYCVFDRAQVYACMYKTREIREKYFHYI